jgi:antitoxin HicB
MRHAYPVQLDPEPDGPAVNLSFPDVPGALTFGENEADALAAAEDCLIAALRGYIKLGRPVPKPSPARGRATVGLPSLVAAKLALYSAMEEAKVSDAEMAGRLKVPERSVSRLLDLDRRSRIEDIEAALAELGLRLEISARKAA